MATRPARTMVNGNEMSCSCDTVIKTEVNEMPNGFSVQRKETDLSLLAMPNLLPNKVYFSKKICLTTIKNFQSGSQTIWLTGCCIPTRTIDLKFFS